MMKILTGNRLMVVLSAFRAAAFDTRVVKVCVALGKKKQLQL